MRRDKTAIRAELGRVLESRSLRSHRMLQKFLSYIVERALEDSQVNLDQYAIAVNGLGKPSDFDASINPLIRIQAGRLRKQLADYYATEGRFNPLRIVLPTGTYQPVFTQHATPAAPDTSISEVSQPSQSQGPSLVCIPRNFAADTSKGWPFISRLTQDYVKVASAFNFCQIMLADETPEQKSHWPETAWHKYSADFALLFDLYQEPQGYNLKCSLVHSLTRQIVWAHAFPLSNNYPAPVMLTPVFRRIANDTLNYERGLAQDFWARQLLASNKPVPSHYQVVLALRQHQWVLAAPQFCHVLHTCEQRLEVFPDDVQAMLVYADMYRNEYLQKFNEMSIPINYLAEFIHTLLELAPDNAYSHMYLAGFYMLVGERELCLQAMTTAQTLNPLDTHLNVTIGLIYMGLGEWQKGEQYIQGCIDLSPIYADWYHIPLCVHHYRAGHYATALKEARKIRLKNIWGPLLRSTLHQRNKQWGKAEKELDNLVQEYPDLVQASQRLAYGFTKSTNLIVKQLVQEIVPPTLTDSNHQEPR